MKTLIEDNSITGAVCEVIPPFKPELCPEISLKSLHERIYVNEQRYMMLSNLVQIQSLKIKALTR